MSRQHPPRVSVVMAVHNEERFVRDAVQSVLRQTLPDFELLVIDDASTDKTPGILHQLADPRVRVLRNDVNSGLTASLNVGLDAARGDYIARLDGDDIAAPDRFARQVEFLDAQPHIGIVGSSRRVVDEQERLLYEAAALTDDREIRWRMLLGNALAHPTVMIRGSILRRHGFRYDTSFRTAQDYELWTRLLCVTRAANLPEPLVTYRRRQQGVSLSRRDEQLAAHDRIAHLAIRRLLPGFAISPEEVHQLRGRYGGQSVREPGMDPAEPKWAAKLEEMRAAFAQTMRGRQRSRPDV